MTLHRFENTALGVICGLKTRWGNRAGVFRTGGNEGVEEPNKRQYIWGR